MLKNKKIVTKIKNILIMLMTIILILGVYINVKYLDIEKIETKVISTEKLKNVKNSLRIAAIDITNRNNKSNLQARMGNCYRCKWETKSIFSGRN